MEKALKVINTPPSPTAVKWTLSTTSPSVQDSIPLFLFDIFKKRQIQTKGTIKWRTLPASPFSDGQGEQASKTAFYGHVRLRSLAWRGIWVLNWRRRLDNVDYGGWRQRRRELVLKKEYVLLYPVSSDQTCHSKATLPRRKTIWNVSPSQLKLFSWKYKNYVS